MKKFINEKLKRVTNVLDNPELLKTIKKNIDRRFVRNLLLLKKKFAIEPNTIFDVGAAIGSWTKAARFSFPNAKIHAFEPIPSSYNIIEKFKINDKNLFTYNFALGNQNKLADFQLNEFSDSSSLLKMTNTHKEIFPFTKNEQTIKVECKRLDSFTKIDIISPSFLKMDVQGAELLVLEGCGEIIKQIDVIELELNYEQFYEGQAKYSDVFIFMKNSGFKSFLQLNPRFSKNKLLWCDILFFRG